MPNGHGGIPRFGSPLVLLLFGALLLRISAKTGWEWTVYPAMALALLFAWRFSWHLFLYPLMEYGGAYSSREALERGTRRHWALTAVLGLACAIVTWHLWPS